MTKLLRHLKQCDSAHLNTSQESIPLRGHSQTTWTKFCPFFTMYLCLVDIRWFFLYQVCIVYVDNWKFVTLHPSYHLYSLSWIWRIVFDSKWNINKMSDIMLKDLCYFSILENKYWKNHANVDKRLTMYVSYVDISWHLPNHVCISFCPHSLWMSPYQRALQLQSLYNQVCY